MSFSGTTSATSTVVVGNDGWWPDIEVGDFQRRYRLPAEYAEAVLADGLQLGMAWTNRRLAAWRAAQTARDLDHVAAAEIGGETLYRIHYRRAVMSYAKAYLLQQFRTINRREIANNEAREGEATEDKFLEFAQQAIADFLGSARVAVELL